MSTERTLEGKWILVTGDSGTIGAKLVDRLLEMEPAVVRVFGRDETKQFYQRRHHQGRNDIRFLIGDIRDRDRVIRAIEGIDVAFHCAALKHVGPGEYTPFEVTQTNVTGTQNLIDACLAGGVGTFILTSSDTCREPDFSHGRFQAARRETRERGHELSGTAPDDLRERPVRERARLSRISRGGVRPSGRAGRDPSALFQRPNAG